MRGAEDLFSIIERKVDKILIFDKAFPCRSISIYPVNAFGFAFRDSNLSVVKRLFEISSELSMKAPKQKIKIVKQRF